MTTVWADLASPDAPTGAVPYIDEDQEPAVDVLNLFYDSVQKMLSVKNGIAVDYTHASSAGAQTINKAAGSVKFAAAAQTLVVTNSLANVSSLILPSVLSDDTTAKSVVVSARAAGNFTLKLNAAATAETVVGFLLLPLGQPVAQ